MLNMKQIEILPIRHKTKGPQTLVTDLLAFDEESQSLNEPSIALYYVYRLR